jgi:nucleolar complex protein 2
MGKSASKSGTKRTKNFKRKHLKRTIEDRHKHRDIKKKIENRQRLKGPKGKRTGGDAVDALHKDEDEQAAGPGDE